MTKRRLRGAEVDEIFKDLTPLNDSQVQFMSDIMPNYIVYSNPMNYAYCTACNQEFSPKLLGKAKQGEEGFCPMCGSKIKYKYSNRLPKWHCDWKQAVFVSKMGDSLVTRIFDVFKRFSDDFRSSELIHQEVYRQLHRGSIKQEIFDFENGEWFKCNLYSNSYYSYYSQAGEPILHISFAHKDFKYQCSLYTDELTDTLKGTRYENCQADKLFSRNPIIAPRDISDYFEQYNHSFIYEYLIKIGFDKIADHLFFHSYGAVKLRTDVNAKKIHDMLLISKQQYNELLTVGDPHPIILACMQQGFNLQDANNIAEFIVFTDQISDFKKYFKFSTHRFRRYFIEHGLTNADVSNYFDYLNMCSQLQYDLSNEFVAMPKDLDQAHQLAVEENNRRVARLRERQERERRVLNKLNQKKLKKLTKEYEDRVKALEKLYNFNRENLSIVVPKDTSLITLEGQKLHHCVGTYVDKVISNLTTILFIRKTDDIETPYYTLEVKDNAVAQCYGYADCLPNNEVRSFVQQFMKAKNLTSSFAGVA